MPLCNCSMFTEFCFCSISRLALLPVIFCLEVSTFVGCGSVMITAALYGVLAIGKKGAHANKTTNSEEIEMKTNLVDKKGDPNYVGEAEPWIHSKR